MLQRPQTSPLFPYTTLFRSGIDGGCRSSRGRWLPGRVGFTRIIEPRILTANVCYREHQAGGELPLDLDIPLDRKSTRLNSSHANISYAVFCLKKKKKIQPIPRPVVLPARLRIDAIALSGSCRASAVMSSTTAASLTQRFWPA